MSLGSVRIDETIVPITRLRLIDGGIEVTAELQGPVEESAAGEVRLFGCDGKPVTDAAAGRGTVIKIPQARAGEAVQVHYFVIITHKQPGKPRSTT